MLVFVTRRPGAVPARAALMLAYALVLAGCATPATPAAPATSAAAPATPSSSTPRTVQFVVPVKVNGLPRSTDAGLLKRPKSAETFLKDHVFPPRGDSVAAAYEARNKTETIGVGAAAGQVSDPASTLRLLTRSRVAREQVRSADPGTAGGVGTCGISRDFAPPLVLTVCYWAEPGSVGWVEFLSSEDRRDAFAKVRAQLRP